MVPSSLWRITDDFLRSLSSMMDTHALGGGGYFYHHHYYYYYYYYYYY